ncbi:MAG TPA: hypothetical protein VGD02_08855 [Gemmatimonadaceae bacterium]
MARAYTIATAALALDVSSKWLDNTLSHFRIDGVLQARQGIARRLTIESLTILSVAILLTHSLEVPLGRAIMIAQQLIATRGRYFADDTLELVIDLPALHSQLLKRLERAVEIAPVPRRGRPPKNTTGRLA